MVLARLAPRVDAGVDGEPGDDERHDDRVLGHMDLCWMNSADIKPISFQDHEDDDNRVRKLSAI